MTDPTTALLIFIVAAILVFGAIGGGLVMAVRAESSPSPERSPQRDGSLDVEAVEPVELGVTRPESSVSALPGADRETSAAAAPAPTTIAS